MKEETLKFGQKVKFSNWNYDKCTHPKDKPTREWIRGRVIGINMRVNPKIEHYTIEVHNENTGRNKHWTVSKNYIKKVKEDKKCLKKNNTKNI